MAIRSFADKDTEAVWRDRRVRRFQTIQAQAKRRLNVLNAVATLEDLRTIPARGSTGSEATVRASGP